MKTRRHFLFLTPAILAIFLSMFFMTNAMAASTYDLVILNGRVMDPECKFDGVRNVGIKGNRIAVITKGKVKGKRTIDAGGHVVAPGFINTHNHAFAPFDQKMMAHDGVTTLLDTEAGASNARIFFGVSFCKVAESKCFSARIVRRSATARHHRPCLGQQPGHRLGRRAHGRPGSRNRGRHHGAFGRGPPAGCHHSAGDP